MNRVIVLSILPLTLEFLIGGFIALFIAINTVIVSLFIFEFMARWNYRRWQYLRGWGLRLDAWVILVDLAVIYLFYATTVSRLPTEGQDSNLVRIDVWFPWGVYTTESAAHEAIKFIGFFKFLRVLRFLRVLKLVRDIAHRPAIYMRYVRSASVWTQALLETLLIFFFCSVAIVALVRIFSDTDPQQLITQFISDVGSRLRLGGNDEVTNSEVVRAVYQVFIILVSMAIVAFFAQLLLPVRDRIKALQLIEEEKTGRLEHIIIAATDDEATGLLEEAIQIWGVNEKCEVVLLIPPDFELEATIHPQYSVEIVRGEIFSRGSWLAADASGANQIVCLSSNTVGPESLSIFLPELTTKARNRGVLILCGDDDVHYTVTEDSDAVRYISVGTQALRASIEDTITDTTSVQYSLIELINDRFDSEVSVLGGERPPGDTNVTIQAVERLLSDQKTKRHCDISKIRESVLIETPENSTEDEEGAIIRKLRDYVTSNNDVAPIIVFVDALHLVGINKQLGERSALRIVPIELLIMYAAYHESVCPGILSAWLLKVGPIQNHEAMRLVDPQFGRTTYRTRPELKDAIPGLTTEDCVIGVLSQTAGEQRFRGFVVDEFETRRIDRGDVIAITSVFNRPN